MMELYQALCFAFVNARAHTRARQMIRNDALSHRSPGSQGAPESSLIKFLTRLLIKLLLQLLIKLLIKLLCEAPY